MAVGALRKLIIETGFDASSDTKNSGETTYGLVQASAADRLWSQVKIHEDGVGIKPENQILESEYQYGTLDDPDKRRFGMSVAGPCNVHLHPEFARLVLDMCCLRDTVANGKESFSYTMVYDKAHVATTDYRYDAIHGAKVNTFTISASNDSQELVCNMEIIGRKWYSMKNDTDAGKAVLDDYTLGDFDHEYVVSKPYIFVDGDIILTAAETSPTASVQATVESFSIEGNNQLTSGPYKRDLFISNCRAGRMQVSGSVTLEYVASKWDKSLLEDYLHGEMILNFKQIGATEYDVTTEPEQYETQIQIDAGDTANFAAGDTIILSGIHATTKEYFSEVFIVKTVHADNLEVYSRSDTISHPKCPYYQWWGVRYDDWGSMTSVTVSKNAMQIWIPALVVPTIDTPAPPTETQKMTINFTTTLCTISNCILVDLSVGTYTASEFEKIQYIAPLDDGTLMEYAIEAP